MADEECTAITSGVDRTRNFLFEPPCGCPRCRQSSLEPPERGTWLRVSGMRQRLAVEAVALGPTGQALLGGG